MTVSIHKVVTNIHDKAEAAQQDIARQFKTKIDMKPLFSVTDRLTSKAHHLTEIDEVKLIHKTIDEAIETFKRLVMEISKLKGCDIRGIQHKLIPLHDYLEDVAHRAEQDEHAHDIMLAKKAQHEADMKWHAEHRATLKPTEQTIVKEAKPKFKDEHAKKIAKFYEDTNTSPHATSLSGAAMKHNETLDSDLLAKWNHIKLALTEVASTHELGALVRMHNHKVDQLLSHYKQVETKCKKGPASDSTKTSYYTTLIHKLGQLRVDAEKLTLHQKH